MRRGVVAMAVMSVKTTAVTETHRWFRSNFSACTTTINVARKTCAPTYVPYPIGGPKSPLVSGANQTVPLYLPGIQTPLARRWRS